MEKSLSLFSIAKQNLRRNPYRTFSIMLLVAVSSGVLFASFLVSASLKRGLNGMTERIWADLMIVPEGYAGGLENVLLSGEPSYFYLDRKIEDEVRTMDGVKTVTSQFYLTSQSASCCDFPVQIIGYNPETDFLIRPWIEKVVTKKGELIAGSNVGFEKDRVSFFAKPHVVAARLSRSGSGMDNAVFASLETIKDIFDDATNKGFCFFTDGAFDEKASVIFVKLNSADESEEIAKQICAKVHGVQVIQRGKFLDAFTEKIPSFNSFLYFISILFLFVTVVALVIIFYCTLYERRREFSILRVLGADRTSLTRIISYEAFVTGALGALSGVLISALIVLPFNFLISQKIAMPFCVPSVFIVFLYAVISVLVLCGASVLTAFVTGGAVSKLELYSESK